MKVSSWLFIYFCSPTSSYDRMYPCKSKLNIVTTHNLGKRKQKNNDSIKIVAVIEKPFWFKVVLLKQTQVSDISDTLSCFKLYLVREKDWDSDEKEGGLRQDELFIRKKDMIEGKN